MYVIFWYGPQCIYLQYVNIHTYIIYIYTSPCCLVILFPSMMMKSDKPTSFLHRKLSTLLSVMVGSVMVQSGELCNHRSPNVPCLKSLFCYALKPPGLLTEAGF